MGVLCLSLFLEGGRGVLVYFQEYKPITVTLSYYYLINTLNEAIITYLTTQDFYGCENKRVVRYLVLNLFNI